MYTNCGYKITRLVAEKYIINENESNPNPSTTDKHAIPYCPPTYA